MAIQTFNNGESNASVRAKINGNATELDSRVTAAQADADALETGKVDKVTGKQLSTEDYSTAEKTKLGGIATGATANQTDAFLKDLANATGVLDASKINQDTTHRFWTDAEKAANTAAIAAATPLLQTETIAYLNRMIAAGDPLGQGVANLLDDFVVTGKSAGWMSKLVMFAPILGTKLVGSLVKFTVEPNSGVSSMVNNNLVEADYAPLKGYSIATNTNKWVDTGVTPLDQGLSLSNICLSSLQPDYTVNNAPSGIIGDNPVSGDLTFSVEGGVSGFKVGTRSVGFAVGGKKQGLINVPSATTFQSFLNGGNIVYDVTGAASQTGDIVTRTTMFKTTKFGTAYYATGTISYCLIAQGMTSAQAKSLSDSLYTLYQKLGRIETVGGVSLFFGTSITAGQGVTLASDRASVITSAAIGNIEYNLGLPSSRVRETITTAPLGNVGGFQRYSDYLNKQINSAFFEYMTNDMLNGDVTTNGDATIIADAGTKLEAIIQATKNKGIRCFLNSAPWNNVANSTKQLAYLVRAALVASNKNIPFIDMYNVLLDTGNPASYLIDTVHLNTAGHLIWASHQIAAAQGNIFRLPVLDFTSIAAGASADLTVTMYGARTNMAVTLGQPVAPTAGIIYQAFVSAADTVTVRAINTTASAIDPASQTIRVTVTL